MYTVCTKQIVKIMRTSVFICVLILFHCKYAFGGSGAANVLSITADYDGGGNGFYIIKLDQPFGGSCGNSPYLSVVAIGSPIGEALLKIATSALLSGNPVFAGVGGCNRWRAMGANLNILTICQAGTQSCTWS